MRTRKADPTAIRRIATIINALVLGAALALLAAKFFSGPTKPASHDSKRERVVYRRANA